MDVLNCYLFIIIVDFGKATRVIHYKGLGATEPYSLAEVP